ncbi:M23 family metallopeptidase [Paenibacillus agricola]|uniref:Peptidoglycan DD-metalloendopeptidase family protein n=1 Tax=Paenibacillus agricola TaxID=2716264 RepID=A0ABX0JE24_9BACL|nr:M23 family metallopeptidase [Paenibacillus agricola]NHN31950.1 peptidoglycan DD-metalloendopeptidase family protein [Paenibacillus agricola]
MRFQWMVLSLLMLSGTASFLYINHYQAITASQSAEAQLSDQAIRLQQDLATKNSMIQQLQNEIIQLSRQAEEVRSKVEEMKTLEQELTQLLPPSQAPQPDKPVSAPAQTADREYSSLPVTAQQLELLTSSALASYTSVGQELDKLQAKWQQSKLTILLERERFKRIPNIWPTRSRVVTSPFGYRKDPFTNQSSFHRGIDIAGAMDDPVMATGTGTVVTVAFDPFHGHHVILEHADGLRTWYMHLNSVLVQLGEHVECGQSIGKLGTSGRSTGPHLHYEVVQHGKSTDPQPFLP